MRDIRLRRSQIMDPPGKRYWPLYMGRDGCRAPMQWDSSAGAGFTTGTPWLPINPDYTMRNVAAQEADPGSLLQLTRRLVRLRKSTPALTRGDMVLFPSPPDTLVYRRRAPGQSVLVALNFSARAVTLPAEVTHGGALLFSTEADRGAPAGAGAALAPHEALMLLED